MRKWKASEVCCVSRVCCFTVLSAWTLHILHSFPPDSVRPKSNAVKSSHDCTVYSGLVTHITVEFGFLVDVHSRSVSLPGWRGHT